MSSPLLEVKDMHVHYGAIHAIQGININVNEGEIVTILGSNGAGKTTTLHSISGLVPISSGEILFDGKPIHTFPAHKIVAEGVAQSPEGRMVFPDLTVQENLEMGAYLREDNNQVKEDLEYMFKLFPRLLERKKQ
jgi:branched-chain amino acid transport system ATP-binding protein